jgi:hypothetical protein
MDFGADFALVPILPSKPARKAFVEGSGGFFA